MYADAAWDTAAQLGYYFMLALFPLVLFLVSLLTILQVIDVIDPLMLTMRRLMPSQAFLLMRGEIARITAVPRGDLLTFGALGAVWAASSGVEALLSSLNRAYEVRETRSYWKVRGTAIVMTFAIAGMIIVGGSLLMFGDRMASRAVAGLDSPLTAIAVASFNYLLGVALLILGLEVVYYYGPNVANQKWRWVSPGSLVGVLLFVLASSGFSLYVRYSNSYSFLYGSVGGVIILMFWLYILGLAFMTGGEINAQVAAAARSRGRSDAPMVGLEGEPPKPAEPPPPTAADAPVESPSDDDPVRALMAAVRRERGHVKAALVRALGHLGAEAEPAVSDLTALLSDEHPAVRAEAVSAIERIGPAAACAAPALHELADRDPALRDAALRALAVVEPDEEPGAA